MTFPGTYNISYYYGDTLEFRVYPKNANGSAFDLDTFTSAKFTLAPTRGAALEDQISCYAAISGDKSNVLCSITPENSLVLDPAVQYVYDVEIKKSGSPYDIVYTLLTGTVGITNDVTLPGTEAAQPLPDPPTDLVLNAVTSSTINVSWTAPESGGQVTGYKVAVIPFTESASAISDAIDESTTLIPSANTEYTFFGLSENTDYSVIISSSNATGDSDSALALTNLTAYTTADDPATINPDYVITADGSAAYLVNGISNDTITVARGQTYFISMNAEGHPFWIQETGGGYLPGAEYSNGVTNNGIDVGTIVFAVPMDAPDTLFYQCQFHTTMGGVIAVINDGAS